MVAVGRVSARAVSVGLSVGAVALCLGTVAVDTAAADVAVRAADTATVLAGGPDGPPDDFICRITRACGGGGGYE